MCGKELKYIQEAFDENWIAPLGRNVDNFETEISQIVDMNYGVALSSGTAAIHLALKLCGVGHGDIVFCSDLTFSASCNPIIYQNAIPVFIDSEKESYNLSPRALEQAFQKHRPKAVVVVDLYGQSADYDIIQQICNHYDVPIVEDAAESLGADYKGKKCGSLGKYGAFSFNGNKIITTSGGGMLVSKDKKSAEKARFWATQSRDIAPHYQHSELGYNYRMSNVLAGIGRGQISVLKKHITKKKEIFEYYCDAFKDLTEISMYPIANWGNPNYWLSVIILKENSKVRPHHIIKALEEENIESRHVWKPMHMQPFFEKYEFYSEYSGQSVSEFLFQNAICLPSDTNMNLENLNDICTIIKSLFT